jgi:hypothetical protein
MGAAELTRNLQERSDGAYASDLLENGVAPSLNIVAKYETGKYHTNVGCSPVRSLERWYRRFETVWLNRPSKPHAGSCTANNV